MSMVWKRACQQRYIPYRTCMDPADGRMTVGPAVGSAIRLVLDHPRDPLFFLGGRVEKTVRYLYIVLVLRLYITK